MSEDLPEADRHAAAPHPRHAARLFGQAEAEAAFRAAWAGGRLHHGWLLTGPRGTGKATLAWRLARALLADAGPDLEVAPGHPVARRMAALSEPRLLLLRPGWDERGKRLREVITVDETRALQPFFGLSAADGGRRAVIVDAADQLNRNAANALLKLLEEPPAGATLFLVAHQPGRLLPTIRSRCRELRCAPLAPDDLALAMAAAGHDPAGAAAGHDPAGAAGAAALAELSGGSVGAAIDLAAGGGAELYAALLALLAGAPRLDRGRAIALAEAAGGRDTHRRDLTLRLLDLLLARLARTGAGRPPAAEAAPGEASILARLAPDGAAGRAWAEAQGALAARAARAVAVNLDPSTLILDTLLQTEQTAAAILSRP